jgi:thiol-disulfide isomerase/thioredoxin
MMFRQALGFVGAVMAVTGVAGFSQQWQAYSQLPSFYDAGLTVEKAFKTAKTPLVIEFYSDACGTCKQVTPMVHKVATRLRDRATWVMVDVTQPDNQMTAQLFGVTTIPRVFVFHPRQMKKHAIASATLQTPAALQQAIEAVL